MDKVKKNGSSNFIGIDLSKVDKTKLPQSLGCVISDLSDQEEAVHTNHIYHSDEPRYDHTRDD